MSVFEQFKYFENSALYSVKLMWINLQYLRSIVIASETNFSCDRKKTHVKTCCAVIKHLIEIKQTTESNDKLNIAKCQNLFRFIAFTLGFQTSICLNLKMLMCLQLLRKPASKPHHSLTVKLPLKQPVRANVDHRVNKWNMQLYN